MKLREYREKPFVRFWGKDDYYLGVELEVEAPDREKQLLGLKPLVWGVNAKKDGSLNSYGWEIVTHPYARNLWLEPRPRAGAVYRFLKLVKSLKDLNYTSHDGGRCGLHVHVCRKAFGPKLGSHFFWFAKLVNGALFRKLSQRADESLDRWTKQVEPKLVRKHSWKPTWGPMLVSFGPVSRYVALNVTPKTVEVRLFRGNMREDRIRKALEAVIAAIEFARTRSSKNWKSNLDRDFVTWVLANRSTYPNLANYLREVGITRTSEDREETLVCA